MIRLNLPLHPKHMNLVQYLHKEPQFLLDKQLNIRHRQDYSRRRNSLEDQQFHPHNLINTVS